jgi:hypothetical protein
MSAGSHHNLFYFSSLIFDRNYLPPLIFDIVFGPQETEAASADAHANLHSKLGFSAASLNLSLEKSHVLAFH